MAQTWKTRPNRFEIISIHLIPLLTAVVGLVNVFSAITPAMLERARMIRTFIPLEVRHGSRLSAVLAGFALLLLSGSLKRRKRVAWLITLAVLFISAISHLIKGLDYEEAILTITLAGWLLLLHRTFHARSDPASLKKGIGVLFYAVCFTMGYGVAGLYILDRHFCFDFSLGPAILQVIIMFTEFYNPGLQPVTEYGRFFVSSIYTVGAVTFGYAFLLLVRPVFKHHATLEERERAKEIVKEFGASSLARFTLFNDKNYFFSRGGSVVPYVKKGRVALVLGDPIGPGEDFEAVIEEFKDFCTHNDWFPAFYQAHPEYLAYYQAAGFTAICIGQEAIVDVEAFTLEGKNGKELRNPVNRLNRENYRTMVFEPPLSQELLEELQKVSDEWLSMMHGSEKQFSLGFFDRDYLRGCPVVAALSPEGFIVAFANGVTEYQKNEVTVDLMRRLREAPPGTMEYLFIAFFAWAKNHHYKGFNLGLSALSGVGQNPGDPRIERALFYIYEHINQFYNFKGLFKFKAKFNPRWEPRYLICPNPASLPAVLTALIRADSGDDFWWRFIKKT